MNTKYLNTNWDDGELVAEVKELKPVAGLCIMVDIVGSTRLMHEDRGRWIQGYKDTFTSLRATVSSNFLKIVGDMVMIWQPASNLSRNGVFFAFEGLTEVIRLRSFNRSEEVRAAFMLCHDVFEVSFLPDVDDVYGKDIALTARVLAKAGPGEIVMNGACYNELKQATILEDDQGYQSIFAMVSGPESLCDLKGFEDKPVEVYRFPTSGK